MIRSNSPRRHGDTEKALELPFASPRETLIQSNIFNIFNLFNLFNLLNIFEVCNSERSEESLLSVFKNYHCELSGREFPARKLVGTKMPPSVWGFFAAQNDKN